MSERSELFFPKGKPLQPARQRNSKHTQNQSLLKSPPIPTLILRRNILLNLRLKPPDQLAIVLIPGMEIRLEILRPGRNQARESAILTPHAPHPLRRTLHRKVLAILHHHPPGKPGRHYAQCSRREQLVESPLGIC